MRIRCFMCIVLLVSITNIARADSSEREAILAVAELAFAAVRSGKPDDWRAIQLAEGSQISFRAHASGEPGKLEFRMSNNEESASGMQVDSQQSDELWTAEPTVLVRGPIAVVWGEYEFRIDGKFAHCGIDAIDMVKIEGEWKIANWMWTVEKDNCPSAPKSQG